MPHSTSWPVALRALLLSSLLLAFASAITLPGTHAQSTATAPVSTIHVDSHLILVDVVVTDAQHNPVHGLTSADFTLLEGNAPQTIKSFEEHRAAPATFERAPTLPPGLFTNNVRAPRNSAVNILLLDTLNTPLQDQSYMRNQILEYLKGARSGSSIAIFGLSTRLTMLQAFTSDPEVLKAALLNKPSHASPLLPDAVGDSGTQGSFTDETNNIGLTSDQVAVNAQDFQSRQQSFQLQLRARYTVDAMNTLARYLSAIPGRKNLIWFSGSFPINVLANSDAIGKTFGGVANSEQQLRATTNLLARSQVAVYPIDARGLLGLPGYKGENSSNNLIGGSATLANDSNFLYQIDDEHSTMTRTAQDTGGKAFINTNNLSHAVASAVEAGSNYYTLSYTPSDLHFDGTYRGIRVNLSNKNLSLSYRRGYFADDPGRPTTSATATAPTLTALQSALSRGAPPATQIIFSCRVIPLAAADVTTEKPTEGNVLNADPKRGKGTYRNYAVVFDTDPRALSITAGADGHFRGQVEFITLLFNVDGTLINQQTNVINANMQPATYVNTVRNGLLFSQQISVPTKGEFFLRLAIRDRAADHLGSLELPVSAIKNLPHTTPPLSK